MRYLTLGEVVALHRALVAASGGADGLRDFGALESALAQPKATFDGRDLYPTAIEKASALAYSLTMNHPFVDGNKRIAHASMAVFLELNGFALSATVDEQEQLMLKLAAGQVSRVELSTWLESHVRARESSG
ncbi:MAG: type II toxin-antitoxin system death-on-curing family toxin [Acidobacteria bacterium]|nr:type II toxin-antitoxin system death-on-curing family toxin [Acidobacteriota bacterium]